MPEAGSNWKMSWNIRRQVLTTIDHLDHPRFSPTFRRPATSLGVMADTLASGYNIFNSLYPLGTGAAIIERLCISWLVTLCGMPADAGGLFVSGGSVANLSGLAVAREVI